MLLREESFSQYHNLVKKVLRSGYKCLTKQPRSFVRPQHISINGDILLTASLTKVHIARETFHVKITHTHHQARGLTKTFIIIHQMFPLAD